MEEQEEEDQEEEVSEQGEISSQLDDHSDGFGSVGNLRPPLFAVSSRPIFRLFDVYPPHAHWMSS